MCYYSGQYSEAEIRPWYDRLIETLKKPVTYEAVFKKYALKKLMRASLVVRDYMKHVYNVQPHVLRDSALSPFDPEASVRQPST